MSQPYLFSGLPTWLFYSAASGLFILGVAAIAVRFIRQPLYRIGIIQWSFVACLLVPVIQQAHLWPAIAVPLAESTLIHDGLTHEYFPTQIELSGDIAPERNTNPQSHTLGNVPKSSVVEMLDAQPAATSVDVSSSKRVSMVALLQFVYVALIALLGGRLLQSWLIRRQLQRSCVPANEQVVRALRAIAGESGKRVKLLTSDRIASPVMWGWFCPTIVVPTAVANADDPSQLQWSLAHEWSHIERHDFVSLQLSNATQFVCFFQPIYWWLRRELMLSQDFLADAFAASYGQSEDYADFLVKMARKQNTAFGAVGLGIADRQSNLFKRIQELVQPSQHLVQRVGRVRVVLLSVTALALIAVFGSIHIANSVAMAQKLNNVADTKTRDGESTAVVSLPPAPGVASITYSGKVIDAITGEPIEGAIVQITRSLSRSPVTKTEQLIETTEHETDKNGQYQFTLPPEQAAQRLLYLEVSTQHPTHQSRDSGGYGHSMIRTNLELGERPFFDIIKLFPGKEISGVVTSPDGKPLADQQVVSFSHPMLTNNLPGESMNVRGSFNEFSTDSNGRFRTVVATPGDATLWIYPKDYAPQAIRLRDRRGDLGTIKAKEGKKISGRVLDTDGRPIVNVGVEINCDEEDPDADDLVKSWTVGNNIRAGAYTQPDGSFQFPPLPPDKYTMEVAESVLVPSEPPDLWKRIAIPKMPYVFVRQPIEIFKGSSNNPVTILALPHVTIRGRFVDSQDRPKTGHPQGLLAKLNGVSFYVDSTGPGEDGVFEFRVPRGLTDARISLRTNEHSALRWKLPGMTRLDGAGEVKLDVVTSDIDGLKIVRYNAPILLVKVVDEQGNQLDQVEEVAASYVPQLPSIANRSVDSSGNYLPELSNLRLQSDGRFRSRNLQPNIDFTLSVKGEGYSSESQVLKLKESETREITVVLKKTNP